MARYEKIGYTRHARKRMRQRKVGRMQVRQTLEHPTRVYESWDKLVAEKTTAIGRVTVVVYVEPSEGEALVVTAWRRRERSEER